MKNILKVLGILFIIYIVVIIFSLIPLPIKIVRILHNKAAETKEEKGLSQNIKGYVLEAYGDKIVAFNTYNKTTHTVKAVSKELFLDHWRIDNVTGPSETGKIVYLLDNSRDNPTSCVLRMCNLDGSENSALSNEISADVGSNYHPIIRNIAISPDGEWLALLNRAQEEDIINKNSENLHFQPSPCYGYYGIGRLEIYRLPSMEKIREVSQAINRGISWFPDNSALVFVGWEDSRCVIKKLEVQSGQITDFDIGMYPKISSDGSILAYLYLNKNENKYELKIMNLDTMEKVISPLTKYERIFGIVGMVDLNRILYIGITTGLPEMYQSKIQNGCPSLKVGDKNRGTYETLHIIENEDCGGFTYNIDEAISYGRVEDK